MNLEEIIRSRPDKTDLGTTATWKLKHLYSIIKKLNPSLVIESGTYTGNSLWLFKNSLNNITLHSYELNYKNLKWRDKSIFYHNYDIEKDKNLYTPLQNDLIYFDDHQNQEKRLKWAYNSGFKHIIFDDNIPRKKLHFFGYPPVPTINMLIEDNKLPPYVIEVNNLKYDMSNPKGRNGGQTYLTYLKIK